MKAAKSNKPDHHSTLVIRAAKRSASASQSHAFVRKRQAAYKRNYNNAVNVILVFD